MLVELLYTSAATADMTDDMLVELLDASRASNARAGVTGLLVYHERSFMQLLEGEEEAVMRLYQRIIGDPRHSGSRIVWKGPIDARGFPDWTMAFVALNDVDPDQLEGYSRYLEEGFTADADAGDESLAQGLMRTLRDTL